MDTEVRRLVELERVAEEQAALSRIAMLVAAGATEAEIAARVCAEIGGLFDAQDATVVRWGGDALRVIGSWRATGAGAAGGVWSFGGDTIAARVVEARAPARVESAADLRTEFARERWAELGWQAAIGAPILVDGVVWGLVTAARTHVGDSFPEGAEGRLGGFSALVAQAIVSAEARRETALLLREQSSLRRIATLVAAGRPQEEVLDAVTAEAGPLFDADAVVLVRWEGVHDEVTVAAAWSRAGAAAFERGSLYHPDAAGPTLTVLEAGEVARGTESSRERRVESVIAAPVIAVGILYAAMVATRSADAPFPAGAETRLRSFADLAAQSIANERAQAELRASRARIVRAADEARQRLERNLHDGAQQRLVTLSLALRLVEQMLDNDPAGARGILEEAASELGQALQELRELARGLHPALVSERGVTPALEALAARAPFPVELTRIHPERRFPALLEATIYYVVSECLTNAAKHAAATSATVAVTDDGDTVSVEIADDGTGGASIETGTGLRGLLDRVEALGGELTVSSPLGAGTLVRAELPLRGPSEPAPSFPAKLAPASTMSTEISWEPVSVLVSADGTAADEMLTLLGDEYGATGERTGDWWRLTIRPIDQFRRGTIIYRAIQAARTVTDSHPDATIYLVTEDGNRWQLPPPALQPD